eukprot:1817894-Alexandrium_andersonii.AAC.1
MSASLVGSEMCIRDRLSNLSMKPAGKLNRPSPSKLSSSTRRRPSRPSAAARRRLSRLPAQRPA